MVIFGLHSCEYDSNDINFVKLEKPEDEVQFGIDLAGVNPTEVIYINNNSEFYYSLFTDGKDILLRQLYWDGVPIETDENTGVGIIHVDNIDDNIHELKLVIAFKTGTESLAEHAGLEMYAGEYNFKVKVIDINNNEDLNLREGIDKNGNLKIEWDKPTKYEVEGYNVYHGGKYWGKLLATIYNPDETFFVDTEYTYGYRNITVEVIVKNSFYLSTIDEINISYTTITEEQFEFERYSKNEFLVKWKNPNPYSCKYVLTNYINDDIVVVESAEEGAIFPAGIFPSLGNSFRLYFLPKHANVNEYASYPYIYGSFSDKKLPYIAINTNKNNKLIHTLNFNSVDTYDISTMEKVFSAKQNKSINTGSKLYTSEDGKIAYDDDNINIFSSYKLENEVSTFKYYYYPYNFIGNDKIMLTEYSGFKIYDIKTKNLLAEKHFYMEDGTSTYNTTTNISPKGSYIYIQYTNHYSTNKESWLEVYEYTPDDQLILLSIKPVENKLNLYFNPNKEDEVIAQYYAHENNRFIISNIKNDDMKEFKGVFMDIDPFTSNLLYKGESFGADNKIYVLDKDYITKRMSIEISANPYSELLLINNNLFINQSYANISTLK